MDNPGATAGRAVLLTRPEAASREFAGRLNRAAPGIRVVVSPLLEIEYVGSDPPDADALVFTSPNAPPRAGPGRGRTAYCVGDATAAAARDAGYAAVPLGGNADGLVAELLRLRPEGRLLHARGAHARGAVAERLSGAGLRVEERIVYEQVGRPLSDEGRAALSLPIVAPLFSPRSAERFAPHVETACDPRIVAMSGAVADAVGGRFRHLVDIVESPTVEAMLKGVLRAVDVPPAPRPKPN